MRTKKPKSSPEERKLRVTKGVERALEEGKAKNLGSRPVQQYLEAKKRASKSKP